MKEILRSLKKYVRKCAEVLKKIWGNSGENLGSCTENFKKFSETICEENFKKPRGNSWENVRKFWRKFEEI